MRRINRNVLFFLFFTIVAVPVSAQDRVNVDYYSGVDGFKLDPPLKTNRYYLNLSGVNTNYSKLLITIQKDTSPNPEQHEYNQENPGAFSTNYLLTEGPGEYEIIIFGTGDRASNNYEGLCTFNVRSTERVPIEVYRSARDTEIKAAFEYLNLVRGNPAAFSREIGVNLAGIAPQPPLLWDERLTRSAQKRAADMAKRNYFGHVYPDGIGPNYHAQQEGYRFPDWWQGNKAANTIESISAGDERGVDSIKNLINDGGESNAAAGHRRHLLGLDNFFAQHKFVGIGLAHDTSSDYGYYFVVHTAPPEP